MLLAEQQQFVIAALRLARGLQTSVRDLSRVDHPAVFTGAIPSSSTTVSVVMAGGMACGAGGVLLQQRLSDVTDGGGGVRVGDWDQELHVLFFFSASSSLICLSPASSCLQLVEWTVICPGLVLLVLAGSGQVPGKAVQVLGQSLQGGGGWSLELCGVIVTSCVWTGGYHSNRARGGRGLPGPVTAGQRGQGGR